MAVVAVSACFFVASVTGAALTVAVRGNEPTPVPFGAAVFATAAAGVGAYVLARLAGRVPRPRRVFLLLTTAGLLASAVPPLQAATTVSTAIWLLIMHAVAALALVPVVAFRTSIGPAGPRAGGRSAGEHAARRHRSDGRQPVSTSTRQTTRRTRLWRMATGDRSRQVITLTAAAGQVLLPTLWGPRFAEDEQPPNVIQPAPYTFGVWLPIFASSLGYAGLQTRSPGRDSELMRAIGWPLAGAFASTGVWAPLVRTGKYWSAQAALAAIAAFR